MLEFTLITFFTLMALAAYYTPLLVDPTFKTTRTAKKVVKRTITSYVKAFDVMEHKQGILEGHIKLNRGQWVTIGKGGRKAQFKGVSGGVIRLSYPTSNIEIKVA